jgi:hypothetical protein
MNQEFRQEFMGMPTPSTPAEIKLRELAERYHDETEAYDRTVCTGEIRRGSIMPANGQECALINRNADMVRHLLWLEASDLGITWREWLEAVQAAGRRGRQWKGSGLPWPTPKSKELSDGHLPD